MDGIAARTSRTQQAIAVLWPSFLVAIAASGLFFSAFDPHDLVPYNIDFEISPLAAYSIGFLVFWLIAGLSSYGTWYFATSNSRVIGGSEP